MSAAVGALKRNSIGRFEVLGIELTSGDSVDLMIDGQWLKGIIEFWENDYFWFSQGEGIPVVLRSGFMVRAGIRRRFGFYE